MKVTATCNRPTFVIELTEEEARGLNTLLRSGTTASIDQMLGISGLQDALAKALGDANVAPLTIGRFNNPLIASDLTQ